MVVADARHHAGLVEEPGGELFVARVAAVKELHGEPLVVEVFVVVLGQVDHAHATGSDALGDGVVLHDGATDEVVLLHLGRDRGVAIGAALYALTQLLSALAANNRRGVRDHLTPIRKAGA